MTAKSVQCPSDGKECAFATCVRERKCYLTKKRLQPEAIPYDPHKRRPSEHGVGGPQPQ